MIDDHNKFTDLVWAEKNNEKSLIRLKDSKLLEGVFSKLCLFSLKQNLNNTGILDQVGWHNIEVETMKFNRRLQPANVQMSATWFKIDQVVKSHFNISNDIYNIGYMMRAERAIDWRYFFISHSQITKLVLQNANNKSLFESATPPALIFAMMISILPKYFFEHVYDHYFLERYSTIYESFNFDKKM